MKKTFLDKNQELLWKAFKGECGKEFAGNPVFMEMFIEKELEKKEIDRER